MPGAVSRLTGSPAACKTLSARSATGFQPILSRTSSTRASRLDSPWFRTLLSWGWPGVLCIDCYALPIAAATRLFFGAIATHRRESAGFSCLLRFAAFTITKLSIATKIRFVLEGSLVLFLLHLASGVRPKAFARTELAVQLFAAAPLKFLTAH